MTASQSFVVFKPSIWSPRINYFMKKRLKAGNFFNNYSDEVTEGGNTIYIPGIADSFAPSAISTTTGTVTVTNVADTKTAINITSWYGVKYVLTDFDAAQVAKKYNLKDGYAKAMGYGLAKTLDAAIIANAVNFTPSVGDSTTLLATTVEKAIGILESNSVPIEECGFFVDPKVYWSQIYANSKFYDASQFGLATLPYGAHSKLYGIPVFITELIQSTTYAGEAASAAASKRNFIAHPTAIVYAVGNLPGGQPSGARIQEKTDTNLAVVPIADIMYGTALLNATRGVKVLSDIS